MRIVNVVREVVHPASPTPPQVLGISDADQRMCRYSNFTFVLFYKPKAEARLLSQTLLKTSLAQVLTLFFPLAGRLKQRQGRPAGVVDVDCNDAGAWYEEAQAEGTLEELLTVGGGFCVPLAVRELLRPSYLDPAALALLESPPVLGVRVTRFLCGGVTLVVALHHALADAHSSAAFIATWSALALGKEEKLLIPPPVHDRSLLAPRQPPRVTSAHPSLTLVPPRKPSLNGVVPTPPPASTMILDLQIGHLAILKQRATPPGAAKSCTAFEALMGLLWRCITRARGLDPAARVRLGTVVDVRKRLQPPLPPGYFGNSTFSCVAETTAGELLDGLLSDASGRVHQAVGTVTDENVRSTLDLYALQDGGPLSVFDTFVPPIQNDVVVTSWKELPFYEADFGMGRPDFVGPPFSFGSLDALITLMPSHRSIHAYCGHP